MKGWEDFTRLKQQRTYSITQWVDMNWDDRMVQVGWGGGTGWGMGRGCPEEETENLLGNDD